jgi:catechol 2,3-dioxygenase-like lactoylglutathione lyase family enzyme
MIRGIHGLFYSSHADETRAFMRDKLKLPFSDVGDGWLIFDLPEGDVGVHPLDENGQPPSGTHDLSFYCDDIEKTVALLRARGVPFKGGIEDHGYGLVTYFTMPGGVSVQLYEPRYQKRGGKRKAASGKKKAATKRAARRPRPAAKTRRPRTRRG